MIELGKNYKDSITSFSGTATARTMYLTGCVRILLVSKKLSKDGKPIEEWFDEITLKTLSGRKAVKESGPAGSMKNPVGLSDPSRL